MEPRQRASWATDQRFYSLDMVSFPFFVLGFLIFVFILGAAEDRAREFQGGGFEFYVGVHLHVLPREGVRGFLRVR